MVVARGLTYSEAEAWQRARVGEMAANPALPGLVILVEHRPVLTIGRSGDPGNLLVSEAELASRGIEYRPSSRGGDITYHGPGQWTVYPILRLEWYNRDLHRYLRLLEECAIVFLAAFGIQGTRRPGLTGVWVERRKVAAVGVAVNRWITWHGFALNIHPDLACFSSLILPCGISREQGGVTSLDELTGIRHPLPEVVPELSQALASVLSLAFTPFS
jgi:lipoate-protein ligase B